MGAEPKLGVNRGNAGKGRRKGAQNKTSLAAKEAIALAFDKMGGIDSLVAWAERDDDNLKVFYSTIWPKIVTLTVGGDRENPLVTEIVNRVVDPNC